MAERLTAEELEAIRERSKVAAESLYTQRARGQMQRDREALLRHVDALEDERYDLRHRLDAAVLAIRQIRGTAQCALWDHDDEEPVEETGTNDG